MTKPLIGHIVYSGKNRCMVNIGAANIVPPFLFRKKQKGEITAILTA